MFPLPKTALEMRGAAFARFRWLVFTPALAFGASFATAQEFPHPVGPGVELTGQITDLRLTEDSGLVASRQYPGVFWTHRDGPGPATLFAIAASGEVQAEFPLAGVAFSDWEDIAIDDQRRVYAGDLGNNGRSRTSLRVYRFAEPSPASTGQSLAPERSWRLRFPDASFDCESLFVWGGNGFVLAKYPAGELAELFSFPLEGPTEVTLHSLGRVAVTEPVTGADLSPDGRRLAILSRRRVWVFEVNGDPASVVTLPPPVPVNLSGQTEGVALAPGGLFITNEGRDVLRVEIDPVPLSIVSAPAVNTVELGWTSLYPDWVLQAAAPAAGGPAWSDVPGEPNFEQGRYTVRLPAGAATQVFRLQRAGDDD